METQSRPITLIRNSEFLYIEENVENFEEGAVNYSLFQVFNPKSPVDDVSLSSIIIPASIKEYYSFEISEYDGISFKVKILFIDQSHSDFINLLRVAATNLYYFSENGLLDWIPIDSITFRLIYPNTNLTNLVGNATEEQTGESSFLVEESISPDCGDVELLSRKLQEMALLFQSKSDIPIDVLEGLFHSIFPRRVTTMSIIEGVGVLISAMDQKLKYRIIRNVFKKLVSLVKNKNLKVMLLENRVVPDLLLNLILNLWTLIESLKAINVSCEKLKDSDEYFNTILAAERSHFIAYIEHVDTLIVGILTILANEQYDLLQSRLSILINAIENLMKLIEFISVKCNEHLKEIESEKQIAKRNALLHFGIAAAEIIYGISTYRPRGTAQRIVEGVLLASNGFALGCALAAKQQLAEAINRQSNTLKRLHELHVTLTQMFNQGKFIMDLSGEEMSYQRETLIEEFVEFRIQYKQFADVLDVLDDGCG